MTLSSASPPHAHACAAADAAASHGVYIAASPDRAPRGHRAAERAHGPCQLLACPRRSPRRAAAARRAPRGRHGAMRTFGADLPDAATKGGTHLLQRQARAQVRKTSRRPKRNPGFVFLFWLFLFNPKWTTQSSALILLEQCNARTRRVDRAASERPPPFGRIGRSAQLAAETLAHAAIWPFWPGSNLPFLFPVVCLHRFTPGSH